MKWYEVKINESEFSKVQLILNHLSDEPNNIKPEYIKIVVDNISGSTSNVHIYYFHSKEL